ncbi:hypothetical protein [Pseudomonas benzenivorans]|uniref:Lipoprotein n=1 Tax=Pseudomonas benzenivorans TaxID=556533 RepID=A0ABY5HD44_9PSED|nr:hypothetical protein [Pseudomonas benzenivorans]UTW08916.1 hypothetical protein KDW96_06290 [Pseudomonas benzenivorans]
MRYWASALVLVAVAGCSTKAPHRGPSPAVDVAGGDLCEVFVAAWVGHFQAKVARLDGQQVASFDQVLRQARQALNDAGQNEAACRRPFCIVQPRAGGRLDSYCGYRIADPGGSELYRWMPWAPAKR